MPSRASTANSKRKVRQLLRDHHARKLTKCIAVREAISEATGNLGNTNSTSGRLELELPPINEASFNEIHDPVPC
jgi:hypothetical protein